MHSAAAGLMQNSNCAAFCNRTFRLAGFGICLQANWQKIDISSVSIAFENDVSARALRIVAQSCNSEMLPGELHH